MFTRHVEVGVAIDVDVAHAFEMREHRHARLLLHALDEALAAARHDDVDAAVEAGQHVADGGAVGASARAGSRPRASPAAFEPGDEAGMDGAAPS